jgi:hypothetical protein
VKLGVWRLVDSCWLAHSGRHACLADVCLLSCSIPMNATCNLSNQLSMQRATQLQELLQLSSELFYDDSLVAAADEATTHSLLGVACRIADAPERAWMQNGQLATGEDSFEDGYALDSSEAVVENEEGDEGKEGEKSGKSRTGRRNCGEKGGMPGDRMLPVPEDPKAGAWHRTEEDQARGWNERAEQQQQQQGLEEEVEVSVSRSTPLLFYGVEGRDMSEDDSASFYNPAEAATVRTLIQRLLACADYGISTNEIGVIAPYRKQVQKIRLLLRKEELGAVRVGNERGRESATDCESERGSARKRGRESARV